MIHNKYNEYNIEDIFEPSYNLLIFQSLEDDVIEFLKNISIEYYPESDDRKYIYSPKLANLILNIGSRTDEFFKNWNIVRDLAIKNIKNKHPNIKEDLLHKKLMRIDLEYYQDIEKNGVCILSDKYIYMPRIDGHIKPFDNFTKWTNLENPCNSWWCAYNNVKHHGYERKKEGNLDHVVVSLAALFLVNCIYKDMSLRPKNIHGKHVKLNLAKNKEKIKNLVLGRTYIIDKQIIRGTKHNLYDVETSCFYYKSRLFNYKSSIKI